jgi:hypothetical protein
MAIPLSLNPRMIGQQLVFVWGAAIARLHLHSPSVVLFIAGCQRGSVEGKCPLGEVVEVCGQGGGHVGTASSR